MNGPGLAHFAAAFRGGDMRTDVAHDRRVYRLRRSSCNTAVIMAALMGIGILATREGGDTRLRLLEFITVDGELWAAAGDSLAHCDGQHVEVRFLTEGYDLAQVQGILRCSTAQDDMRRLQGTSPQQTGALVVKIIPQHAEYLPAQRRVA